MKVKKIIVQNVIVIVIASILQGIWEYVVCGLFYEFETIRNMNSLMLTATVGDVLITLVIFNMLYIITKSIEWKFNIERLMIIVLYSFAAAMYFESRGLYLDRWSYTNDMPLLFETGIGILPVLQLVILIPVTLYIERLVTKWYANRNR